MQRTPLLLALSPFLPETSLSPKMLFFVAINPTFAMENFYPSRYLEVSTITKYGCSSQFPIEGMIRVNNLATGRFSLRPLVSVAARVSHLVHQDLILHVGLAAPLLMLRYIQISGIVDITIQCCRKSYFFNAHHNGLFNSALLNACPALIRVRFLKNCHYDFKCCVELVDANDFENIYLEHLTVIMMANACLTSLQTVFSMFMVRTPNPRPFTFTRSVL